MGDGRTWPVVVGEEVGGADPDVAQRVQSQRRAQVGQARERDRHGEQRAGGQWVPDGLAGVVAEVALVEPNAAGGVCGLHASGAVSAVLGHYGVGLLGDV